MVSAKLEQFEPGGNRENQDANLYLDRQKASELLNVSSRTTATVSKVLKQAAQELIAAVEQGMISVDAATASLLCIRNFSISHHLVSLFWRRAKRRLTLQLAEILIKYTAVADGVFLPADGAQNPYRFLYLASGSRLASTIVGGFGIETILNR